jgi:2-hydroxy-6-oxonona-2,4-dienedioate hydrolase
MSSTGAGQRRPPGSHRASIVRRRLDRVKGLALHARYVVDQAPDASPVVLVHGLVVSSSVMVPVLAELGRHHPTYAPDLPGYGLSAKPPRVYSLARQAEYLGSWMDTVGLHRATLVGVSLGTQVLSHLAVTRPELVDRAVLVSPTMDPAARGQFLSLIRWARELPYEIDMLPIMLRDYARAGVRRALRSFDMARADEPEWRLPRMKMPTLVVRGELDPLVTQEWAESVAAMLPDGRLAVIDDEAHALNFSAPGQLARIVHDFITVEPRWLRSPAA